MHKTMKGPLVISSFLTRRECTYLLGKYSRGFLYYRNRVYRFKGVDVPIEEEPWLLERLIQHRVIRKTTDIDMLRVQKLNAQIKCVDSFHVHTQPYSFVVFLNGRYGGGAFTYLDADGNEVKHKGRTGSMLFFGGDLPHKVNQVNAGERFTLVAFLKQTAIPK